MGLVVSDSSTLIHLAAIGRLALLKEFYGHITVPPAVWREVVEEGEGRAGAVEVEQGCQAGWIEVVAPADTALLRLLGRDLDDGESEVIALAVEQRAALVLLDESDARRTADLYGLSKTGIIGLLIRAKQEGCIESLKPELDRLLHQGGFWIRRVLPISLSPFLLVTLSPPLLVSISRITEPTEGCAEIHGRVGSLLEAVS